MLLVSLLETFRAVVIGRSPAATAALSRGEMKRLGRVTQQLQSPYAPSVSQLQQIVFSDILGSSYRPVDRCVAMGVPAVARLRHLLCGTIARMPLVALQGDTLDTPQPGWMQRTDTDLSPYHRMLWTVDDCLFYGWSLWIVRRGAPSDGSPILDALRCPWERWRIDGDGVILVDDEPAAADEVVLIPGPHGGLLEESGVIIRMAADNLNAAAGAARNPNPNVDLHYTGDVELQDSEIDALIQRWADARAGLNGGVGYSNKWLEAKPFGTHDANLLVNGRNADAVDIARAGSVPAALLDATAAGASLTYETVGERNQQFLDYGAQLYTDPIAARLSLDDVVPRGHRTAFDVSQLTTLTPNPTGAPTSD